MASVMVVGLEMSMYSLQHMSREVSIVSVRIVSGASSILKHSISVGRCLWH